MNSESTDKDEAIMFLHHPILGRNLWEITMEMLAVNDRTIGKIPGETDAMKFRSSMTLFNSICPDSIFSDALQKYYGGKAAAYYGIPSWMVKYVASEYLPQDITEFSSASR